MSGQFRLPTPLQLQCLEALSKDGQIDLVQYRYSHGKLFYADIALILEAKEADSGGRYYFRKDGKKIYLDSAMEVQDLKAEMERAAHLEKLTAAAKELEFQQIIGRRKPKFTIVEEYDDYE